MKTERDCVHRIKVFLITVRQNNGVFDALLIRANKKLAESQKMLIRK